VTDRIGHVTKVFTYSPPGRGWGGFLRRGALAFSVRTHPYTPPRRGIQKP